MKKVLKVIGAVIIIIVIAILGMSCFGGESIPENVEYTSVELVQMYDELYDNAYVAEETYSDMYVKVEGVISVVDSDGNYIALEVPGDEYWLESVSCYFTDDTQREILKTKSVGDTVIIEGQISDIGEVLGYSIDIHTIQ